MSSEKQAAGLDPERLKAMATNPWLVLPLALLVCWGSIIFVPASYLTVVGLILGLYALVNGKRWIAVALLVLLHPVPLFFFGGVASYWSALPRILVAWPEERLLPRLDRDTRAQLASVESHYPWGGWVRLYPHNAGLRTMAQVFGIVKGGYDGTYPGRRETEAEIWNMAELPVEDFLADRVTADGETVTLVPGLGARLFDGFGFRRPETDPAGSELRVSARLLGGRCLMVLLRQRVDGDRMEVVVLIDADNGRAFACHSLGMPVKNPGFSYFEES